MATTVVPKQKRVETISADFSFGTLAELQLDADTRGAAARDGRVTDPEALAYIRLSNDALRRHKGHPWLKRRAVWDIPRLLDGVPYPLFPPRVRGRIGDLLFRVLLVYDTAGWLSLACSPRDPLGQFEGPVPVVDEVDVVTVLALSNLSYYALESRRRDDALLQEAIVRVGGGPIRYATRPLLTWLKHRGFEATEPA
jgi:hypothetical protein